MLYGITQSLPMPRQRKYLLPLPQSLLRLVLDIPEVAETVTKPLT